MAYRISKSSIDHIAEVLPDAYVLNNDGKVVELVTVDQTEQAAYPVAVAVEEENIDQYRKEKRQRLIDEVREVQSFKPNVRKRVLCAIVNDAVNSILA